MQIYSVQLSVIKFAMAGTSCSWFEFTYRVQSAGDLWTSDMPSMLMDEVEMVTIRMMIAASMQICIAKEADGTIRRCFRAGIGGDIVKSFEYTPTCVCIGSLKSISTLFPLLGAICQPITGQRSNCYCGPKTFRRSALTLNFLHP